MPTHYLIMTLMSMYGPGMRTPHALAATTLLALTLTACGTGTSVLPTADDGHDNKARATAGAKEVATLTPRAVLAYDGGLKTLDLETGKTLDTTAHEGFLRLNPAGDGQHVMVSDGDVFRVFDAGIRAEPHGGHYHLWQAEPSLTDVTYEAPKAGHVVLHDGWTTLFADGSGAITTIDSADIAKADAKRTGAKTEAPHHGVAIALKDGGLLTTHGTKDARTTVQFKREGAVVSETTDCPGVHGEATAKPYAGGDVAVFGCENGPVIFKEGAFHKVAANDAYARTGNLAGHHDSPIVLADYKVDQAAKPERTTRVGLVDTVAGTMKLVDLGSAYWFRSLARGPHGEGVVLTNDGNLQIIDVLAGTVTKRIPVIKPWLEDKDWQKPGPQVKVVGDRAYITDVATKELVVVDLEQGTEVKRHTLDVVPTELAVVTGYAEGTQPHAHN